MKVFQFFGDQKQIWLIIITLRMAPVWSSNNEADEEIEEIAPF